MKLNKYIELAYEFHVKNNLQLGDCDQSGMYERNNLLLEEIGELQTELINKNEKLMYQEAIDVMYILFGNLVAFGIEELEIKVEGEQFEFSSLVYSASKLAQATRKRFDGDYLTEFLKLNHEMLENIYRLFPEQSVFEKYLTENHQKAMRKERKKIGDSYVISNFN